MSAIPGDVDAGQAPPLTIPLRHFVVGLAFLVSGLLAGLAAGRAGHLAHVHLYVAGWVCLTIMGAMTQFVPVWSAVALHDEGLAALQLPLAAAGFAGLAGALLTGRWALLPLAGLLALGGVWTFVYNVARTLARARPFDATETHFAVALGWFAVVTALGLVLALDLAASATALPAVLPAGAVDHARLLGAHATVAVFGVVWTTVAGALYQLATMFTQVDLSPVEERFQRVETATLPLAVAALAGGRLLALPLLARAGGVALALAVAGVALVVGHKLVVTSERSAMLSRYAVAVVALLAWSALAAVTWAGTGLGPAVRFGAPASWGLLVVAGVGFVVCGTLYHVVPFVVWVNRYSDRVGLEPVPMVDDLYDARLARADGLAFGAGAALVGIGPLVGLPALAVSAGWVLAAIAGVGVAGNLLLVVHDHSGHSPVALVTEALLAR